MEKDEDFLQIGFYQPLKNKPDDLLKVDLIYEIDSLERSYTIENKDLAEPIEVAIVTNISGNIRFIHLMPKEEYQAYKNNFPDSSESAHN
jgi:hypothetical protein